MSYIYTQNKPKTSATLNPMQNIHQNHVCLKTCLNFLPIPKYSKKNPNKNNKISKLAVIKINVHIKQ